MKQQFTLMKFDPATGEEKPYPSHAAQWRDWHGKSTAWLFNPWSGDRRHAGDVGSDPFGHLILPPGEPIFAESISVSEEFIREVKKLTQWRFCMSYNDSYFGEPQGLVKRITAQLDRLIPAAPNSAVR
jgi:hypothetical protein